jgi:autotransporter-associated beta strand protein
VNNLYVQSGTVTFSGGQLNFTGSGTYYSNYVSAGRTAIFNTPFGGAGSPDKWGTGTAVYNGASTSGGFFSLNQGTLGLGNNAALSTVPLHVGDVGGVNFVTVQSADATAHTLPNYLLLYATNFSFGAGGNLTFSGYVNVGANTTAPKTMAISNGVTTLSGIVSNTAGLTKTGLGTLVLSGASANTYGSTSGNGNTTVKAGTLKLGKTAAVAAVASGSLVLNSGGTLLLGASDQIADTVPMTLSGGTFQTGGFNEQLGTLNLAVNSVIDLGAGASVLKFAASSGISWTAGTILTVTNWNGSINGGGADRLVFGATSSALTAAQVGQIKFANPPGFPVGNSAATILGTGEVVPLTAAPLITAQPTNRNAVVGDAVSLAVTATGTPAPAYQWRFYGTNLPAASAASLELTNITLGQAGTYFVVLTNLAGSTNSSNAVLSVYATAVPRLSGAGDLANGRFELSVTGVPGYRYAVLASTDFVSWSSLLTNGSPFVFSDTNAGGFLRRFYRAQYVP